MNSIKFWLVEGRSPNGFVDLRILEYEDQLPSSCTFTDKNVLENMQFKTKISRKFQSLKICAKNILKISETFGKLEIIGEHLEKAFIHMADISYWITLFAVFV